MFLIIPSSAAHILNQAQIFAEKPVFKVLSLLLEVFLNYYISMICDNASYFNDYVLLTICRL